MLWGRVEQAIEQARALHRERRKTNRRIKHLQREVETDPLTGLNNRRFMSRTIASERKSGDRREHSTVVMIDLDHFKKVNDTLGHQEGDRVLCETAEVIRDMIKTSDLAARWGGEEFLILRQSEDLTEAWIWADDLRQAITDRVKTEDPIHAITASIGVDVLNTQDLCEEMISRADRAMYTAKEHGRNRVCTWPMAVAMNTAMDLHANPMMTPRARLTGLIQRLERSLGKTQLEHVGDHSQRVLELTGRIAEHMTDNPEEVNDLALAAEFHDIGKIGIPEELLAMPRRLSENERRFVTEHARFGADLLRACGASDRAANAVERHHRPFSSIEQAGMNQDNSARLASIISTCDAVVTMLSHRNYASPKSQDQVLAELRVHRGKQFDPQVVDVLRVLDYQQRRAA